MQKKERTRRETGQHLHVAADSCLVLWTYMPGSLRFIVSGANLWDDLLDNLRKKNCDLLKKTYDF